MKRLLMGAVVAVLAAVSLAGCTTLGDLGAALNTHITNPLNDQQVKQVGNSLGVANSAVVGYSTLPLCPVNAVTLSDGTACHQKVLLKTLANDMHVAVKAYSDLVVYQQSHPQGSTIVGGTFGTLLAQAQSAVGEVQSLVALYHIGSN